MFSVTRPSVGNWLRHYGIAARALNLSNEEYIATCVNVWGSKYQHHKTEYVNARTKVVVTCPKH